MAKKTLAGLALAATLLSGCAGMNGGVNGGDNRAAIDANFAQFSACMKAVDALPEYAMLLPHTSNGQVAELTDNRLPTPEEARLIVARADAKAPCRQSLVAAFAAPAINRPDAAQIWSAGFTEGLQLTAHFARREMTWGQYAGAGQSLLAATRARLAEADQRDQAARRANIIAAASVLSAMPNAFNQQPQTIYVRPCTIYSQIAHAC